MLVAIRQTAASHRRRALRDLQALGGGALGIDRLRWNGVGVSDKEKRVFGPQGSRLQLSPRSCQ